MGNGTSRSENDLRRMNEGIENLRTEMSEMRSASTEVRKDNRNMMNRSRQGYKPLEKHRLQIKGVEKRRKTLEIQHRERLDLHFGEVLNIDACSHRTPPTPTRSNHVRTPDKCFQMNRISLIINKVDSAADSRPCGSDPDAGKTVIVDEKLCSSDDEDGRTRGNAENEVVDRINKKRSTPVLVRNFSRKGVEVRTKTGTSRQSNYDRNITASNESFEENDTCPTCSRTRLERKSLQKYRPPSRKIPHKGVRVRKKSRTGRGSNYERNITASNESSLDSYQDTERSTESDGDDPLLDRLKEIHQGIKRINEEGHRNIFEFERLIDNRVQQAHTEGGVRMAEYLLRRKTVKNGLCVIWTKKDSTGPVDLLRNAYSKFRFEIMAEDFRRANRTLPEIRIDKFDFIIFHFSFYATDRNERKLLEWLHGVETEMKSIPKLVFISRKEIYEESYDSNIPHTIIVRYDSQKYIDIYARALQRHGSSIDMQTILKIVEDEEWKDECMIATNGGISAKVFFQPL